MQPGRYVSIPRTTLVLRHRTGRSAWLAIQTTETCPTATTRQSRRSHPIALRHHRRYTTMPNLTQVRLVSKGFVRQASKLGYSQVALSNLESRAQSVGHCNTMGTASTMNAWVCIQVTAWTQLTSMVGLQTSSAPTPKLMTVGIPSTFMSSLC